MVHLKDYKYTGEGKFKLNDYPTHAGVSKSLRPEYEQKTAENRAKMIDLQDKFYADGREGLVVLFQAMDAAGKDGTIKHVMSGLNPQGVKVHSFKQPSHEELAHDYLWRAVIHLPERGQIGLFNRSYYEDVLVARVHHLQKTYKMPYRCVHMDEKDFFDLRFKRIREFEEHLYENGYRVLKVMLNVSKAEQKKRFLARIDDESKNWKFSSSDLKERALWPQYMEAFEDAIGNTATKHAPWYVLPADQKWVTRYLVSEAMLKALQACDPHYPEMPRAQVKQLESYRTQLTSE